MSILVTIPLEILGYRAGERCFYAFGLLKEINSVYSGLPNDYILNSVMVMDQTSVE